MSLYIRCGSGAEPAKIFAMLLNGSGRHSIEEGLGIGRGGLVGEGEDLAGGCG